MLDKTLITEDAESCNDSGAVIVTGAFLANNRWPSWKRLHLAEAIAAGTVTVVALTPRQAALLCRVAPSAVCAPYRKPKTKKPIVLREVWDAAPVDEQQDLALDIFVIPLGR